MLPRGISLITGAAFIALIVLIFGLGINGLLQLRALDSQFGAVIDIHNRKIDFITQTQVAAHMRTDSLFHMALTEDPFERDKFFMEYNRAGFLVGSGRNALRQMGFTTEEKYIFDTQSHLIRQIESLQDQVINLLHAERNTAARRLFVEQAVPVQQAFNLQLANMRNLYHRANLKAQQQARRTYRQTFILTLVFCIAATALALLIALATLKKIRFYSQQILDQMVELERSRAALHEEATHDPLTGLANRRLFYDRLQQAIRSAHRYGTKLGILYVDLDHFKEINDQHGHHVGDAVLTEVAKRLTSSVRDSDSVARLGGDEFVVLLEGVQGRDDLLAAAHKIEQELNTDTNFYGLALEIAASIGQALYPEDGNDEDALLRAADAAMYRIKSGNESERQARLPFSEV